MQQARSEALDAVRGIAILLVVGYHYFPGVVKQGQLGVDLFFVLSGYLIGGILLDNRGAAGFFATFYGRRAFRILPLYWLLLAFVALDQPLWRFLLFGQTVAWATGRFPLGDPIGITWSLAVEEQFYLLLPALVWAMPPRWLVRVLWACVIAAPVWRWALHPVATYGSFLWLPCRLDALMGGTLIACMQRGHAMRPAVWGLLALAAPVLDIGFRVLDPAYDVIPLSVVALGFATALMVVLGRPPGRLTGLRPLTWLGIGAYSIYLFHLPVLRLTGSPGPAIAVTGTLALVLWWAVEAPLIRFARARWRYRPASGPAPAPALMA